MLMLTPLILFAGLLSPASVFAQSATVFPVALGPEANLQGEIIGTGADGTTFVLSGETLGIEFTLTLAQDASHVEEQVAVPSRSYELDVECTISADSAVCLNVVVSAGVTSTLPPTTLPYSPFAVPVSTSGVLPSSTSASGSTAASGSASASASASTGASSAITSQITISATNPSASTATLASPSVSEAATSNGRRTRVFTAGIALTVPMAVALLSVV